MTTTSLHDAARATLQYAGGSVTYYRLQTLQDAGLVELDTLPFSIRVLLENMLRKVDGYLVTEEDVRYVASWKPQMVGHLKEVPFMPARCLHQDLTGIPVIVDLAAMRNAVAARGGDPKLINPLVPCDLVIDHSVQVDYFGVSNAFEKNSEMEYARNGERYSLLKWSAQAFQNLRVIPPDTGICHQVNLEFLASVIMSQDGVAFPDTVVGTDSHTTMVNGISVLGWGVGGIEAEAVMLGQPYYIVLPQVIGVRLSGELREGVTATDLVLTVTQQLRAKGVVEKFVEYFGPGLSRLSLPDRATLANMSPEYGATCGFFPIDEETLRYMRNTGRAADHIDLVEKYAKEQHLFRAETTPDPKYTDVLDLDMSTVESSLAGPARPQDRIALTDMKDSFRVALDKVYHKAEAGSQGEAQVSEGGAGAHPPSEAVIELNGQESVLDHGAVVISAITSCTNTSNPSVMIGAGLLAKKAVQKGLKSKPWVKTSLAPGSRTVTDYLDASGVMPYLEQLGFNLVGYGCTTCIGNSGPLPEVISQTIDEHDLVATAVLSGNRNFEGRIHPSVKANYLASPVLVVAYALAGNVTKDLTREPLGNDQAGQPVYLRDIWPSQDEVRDAVANALKPELFQDRYGKATVGDPPWQQIPAPAGDLYAFDLESSYIQEPPYFKGVKAGGLKDLKGARALAVLGDSVTTDHISPAGSIPARSPAGQFLIQRGVEPVDFNIYGTRRGNHEVMVRGTYGNIRLKNFMTPDREGDWTVHLPDGEVMRIFDASMKYQAEGTPLIVLAGKELGTGSSRDWAAKGPLLLGVQACIAESYERIHRNNLIGMGILPLQFLPGQNAASLGLTGREVFDIAGISDLTPGKRLTVRTDGGGAFEVIARIDTPVELEYFRDGGVLHTVLERILRDAKKN